MGPAQNRRLGQADELDDVGGDAALGAFRLCRGMKALSNAPPNVPLGHSLHPAGESRPLPQLPGFT
jgi:hypothetical protein